MKYSTHAGCAHVRTSTGCECSVEVIYKRLAIGTDMKPGWATSLQRLFRVRNPGDAAHRSEIMPPTTGESVAARNKNISASVAPC